MTTANSARLMVMLVLVSCLFGCKNTTSPPSPVAPEPIKDATIAPTTGTGGIATYEEIQATVRKLKRDATAQAIADMLTAISAVRVSAADRSRVYKLEEELLRRLRGKVKSEVLALHGQALRSSSYAAGYTTARKAGSVLALYPLSDAPDTIKEAEDLSMRQKDVLRSLELIRRQRYNHWAAGQAEQALKQLRENGKDGRQQAIAYLCVVEPALLESSVAALYSYTVAEILDEFKKHEKASVAKELTDPSVTRRNLEDF